MLRGSGATSTILKYTGLSTCQGGNGNAAIGFESTDQSYPLQPPANIYNWTSGYSQGTTTIGLSSLANIVANQTELFLSQCDPGTVTGSSCTGNEADNGNWYTCADGYGEFASGAGCSVNGPDTGFAMTHRWQVENVLVTGCSPACGTNSAGTVTIDRPLLHPNWSSSQNPQAWLLQTTSNVGIENLTVDLSTLTTPANCVSFPNNCNGGAVTLTNVSNAWISGVAVLNAWDIGIWDHAETRSFRKNL